MLPVPHKQTERKGSGANPGPLAKSSRNSREVETSGWTSPRDKVQPFPVPSRPALPREPTVRAQHSREGAFYF